MRLTGDMLRVAAREVHGERDRRPPPEATWRTWNTAKRTPDNRLRRLCGDPKAQPKPTTAFEGPDGTVASSPAASVRPYRLGSAPSAQKPKPNSRRRNFSAHL
eukprot:525106-Pyramimonas_sp.AAC.1